MRLGPGLLYEGRTLQGARPKLADFCSATMAEFYSAVDNPGVAEMAHLLPRVGATAHLAAGTPPGATMVMSFEVDDWRGVHWHSGDVQAYMTPRMLAQ